MLKAAQEQPGKSARKGLTMFGGGFQYFEEKTNTMSTLLL